MYTKSAVALLVAFIFICPTWSLANDFVRVVIKASSETDTICNELKGGTIPEAKRILKNNLFRLGKEVKRLGAGWEDYARVKENFDVLSSDIDKVEKQYLRKIVKGVSVLEALDSGSPKAPPQIQEAIENLLYAEESFKVWRTYIKSALSGTKALSNKIPNNSQIGTLNVCLESIDERATELRHNEVSMLLECLIASRKMLSGKKVDVSFLEKINTGCANCGGEGCVNCMLSPEERQELWANEDGEGTGCANCGGAGCANCMLSPEERQHLFDE